MRRFLLSVVLTLAVLGFDASALTLSQTPAKADCNSRS